MNEVKRTGLTFGPTQTIIDTGKLTAYRKIHPKLYILNIITLGIEQPTGLAIDWISELMFVSSSGATYNHISACNLEGEYSTVILQGDALFKVTSLAVDPTR